MPDSRRAGEDLGAVVRMLVDEPDHLTLDAVPMRRALVFEVACAPGDVGKLIGRRGRTIRALRTVLDSRAEVDGAQYGLELLDG